MKNIAYNFLYSMSLLMMIFAGNGCSEVDIDSQNTAAPQVETDALETYRVGSGASSDIYFKVVGNVPWKITSSDESVCVASPSSSAVSSLSEDVVVTVNANPATEQREATLTISGEGTGQEYVVKVVQAAKGALDVEVLWEKSPSDPNKYQTIEAAGTNQDGKDLLKLTTNYPWTITATSAEDGTSLDWVSFSKSQGEAVTEETVKIIVSPNSVVKRECVITVQNAEGDKHSFTLEQDGVTLEITEEAKEGDTTEERVDFAGGSKSFRVNTGVEWTAGLVNPDELNAAVVKNDDGTFTVKLGHTPSMDTREPRMVEVGVYIDGTLCETVSVLQKVGFDILDNGKCESVFDYDTYKGGVVITAKKISDGWPNVKLQTRKDNWSYGTYVWKVRDLNINVSEGTMFKIHCQREGANAKGNWHLLLPFNKDNAINSIVLGGADAHWGSIAGGYWSSMTTGMTEEDLKELHTIQLEIKRINDSNAEFIWIFNGDEANKKVLKVEDAAGVTLLDEIATGEKGKGQITFGLDNVGQSGSSCTIESFVYTPAETTGE
ncbi:BACON domain-containing carbohydrate-binding protein [uncultured Bacteroides sp.]|uniref:BACON domain-containing protein n=1 Tax=uncultured Bacteroides sp. TaxID=162156 RepID=UPI002675A80F|nr:BACON domain-containing carbohydrate-binding protein [uncultured Bacteroides sp.]